VRLAHRHPAGGGPRRLPLPPRALAVAWERGTGPAPRGARVVHAPTLLLPPARRHVPLVVTIHDAVPWTHPQTLTPRGVGFHRRMAERAAREAAAVVVPTHAVAAELARHLPLDPARLHVVPHGVSAAVSTVPADAEERARRLGLPAGGYLFTLATLEPRKGLDTAVRALADPAAPDLPLLVAGPPGWGDVDPLALARELALPAGRVRLLGRLDDPSVAVALSRATALVAPSRAEGFGLPVLEAMAHGLPAVVTDVPALVETGGDAVVTVPVDQPAALAAALREVCTDPAVRERLAAAGRRRTGGFTWAAAAGSLWRIYHGLAGGGEARTGVRFDRSLHN
jgi:glycosyltransferase involved in cell wall biosynthesis